MGDLLLDFSEMDKLLFTLPGSFLYTCRQPVLNERQSACWSPDSTVLVVAAAGDSNFYSIGFDKTPPLIGSYSFLLNVVTETSFSDGHYLRSDNIGEYTVTSKRGKTYR